MYPEEAARREEFMRRNEEMGRRYREAQETKKE